MFVISNLQYSNAWDLPLKTEGRVKFFPGLRIQAACGSTFATNIQKCLNEKGNYLLDAVYGCVCMARVFLMAMHLLSVMVREAI